MKERHDIVGAPRSTIELRFYATLHPCRVCGSRDADGLRYLESAALDGSPGNRWAWIKGPCPGCGTERTFFCYYDSDLFAWEPTAGHLGGPEPSEIIGPHEFLAEIDRLAPTIPDSPLGLTDYIPYETAWKALNRSKTCWNELAKFLPENADEIPLEYFRTDAARADRASQSERFTRTEIESGLSRFTTTIERYRADLPRYHAMQEEARRQPPAPPPAAAPFSAEALEQHRIWTRHGAAGQGRRLEVTDFDASRARLSAQELSGTTLSRVTLADADLSMAEIAKAQWTEVRAPNASFSSAKLAGSVLTRCDFTEVAMALTKLGDSQIDGCAFDRAQLDRSSWYRCDIARSSFCGAVFGNASLDDSVFVDCDFRGASLAMDPKGPMGGMSFTWFFRCDFRDVDWTGRMVHEAVFEDCLFAGARGRPHSADYVRMVRPSLDPDGLPTPGVELDDVLRVWGIDPGSVRRDPPGKPPIDRPRDVQEYKVENGRVVGYSLTSRLSPLLLAERARGGGRG